MTWNDTREQLKTFPAGVLRQELEQRAEEDSSIRSDRLSQLIGDQREVLLRIEPNVLDPARRMEYIKTYVLAAAQELHEALAETPWKTWSTRTEFNTEAYFGELRDVWQFLTDLMILAYPDATPRELADKLDDALQTKWQVNLNRAENGYDGRNKCPGCGRALDDPTTSCGEPGELHGMGKTIYCEQRAAWLPDTRTGDDLKAQGYLGP